VRLAEWALPEDRRETDLIHRCAEEMRSEYALSWDRRTRPYPGVREMLAALERRRIPQSVFSNKPAEFTRAAVDKLLPDHRFEYVLGVEEGLPRKPDPTGARRIARGLGIPAGRIVFLGDTRTDMRTARAAGNYAVGALWGFRSAAELEAHGAHRLIRRPAELLDLFSDWKDPEKERTT